jgi:hypothetical protein
VSIVTGAGVLFSNESPIHLVVVFAAIYCTKLLLQMWSLRPTLRVSIYGIILAGLVAYVYLRIVDWGNVDVEPRYNVYIIPIWIFTVPSMTFALDVWQACRGKCRLRHFIIRSAIELTLGVPLWGVVCALFAVFVLGWVHF